MRKTLKDPVKELTTGKSIVGKHEIVRTIGEIAKIIERLEHQSSLIVETDYDMDFAYGAICMYRWLVDLHNESPIND